jgi:hypothetical protein
MAWGRVPPCPAPGRQPLPAVDDIRRRLGLGIDPGQPGQTVAEWMNGWLAGKQRTKRASTVRGYESHPVVCQPGDR